MANANYQLVDKITFYPSAILNAYVTGRLSTVTTQASGFDTQGLSKQDIFSLITLNPVKTMKLTPDAAGSYLAFRGADNLFYNDFFMVLNHDLKTADEMITIDSDGTALSLTTKANDCFGNVPSFDGWSLATLDTAQMNDKIDINFINGNECNIGTILWGKSFTVGQNVDVNQTLDVKYGNKLTKSVGGTTFSKLNYGQTQKWNKLDAWELGDSENPSKGTSRNGIRTWSVNFSLLQDSKMMPQNAMLNSNGWTQDSNAEYSYAADGTSSSTDANTSDDFYNRVIKMTMGSHLPLVVNISESTNPDQWAVVRISDYKITQSNPKFVNYKLVLEEQI